MEINRGIFDPLGASAHDRKMGTVLHPGETVTSAGFGALLPPGMRPEKGKVFVTSLRLAVVLDDPALTPIWSSLWADILQIRIKKGFMGATAFLSIDGLDLAVDSTKSLIGDIERAWVHLRTVLPQLQIVIPTFMPSIDVLCGKCSTQLRPGTPICGMCLCSVGWPAPLDVLSSGIEVPDSLLPNTYSDGSTTQRSAMVPGLATLAAAAICLNDYDALNKIQQLTAAIQDRSDISPESFGDLPAMKGVGDPTDTAKFWTLACKIPHKLAEG